MEDLRKVKFNGKVYGKQGSYSIYVNNQKIEVSDILVRNYQDSLIEEQELKNFKIGNIRILLHQFSTTKEMYVPTLEELMEAKNSLEIEVLFVGVKDGNNFEVIAVKNSVYQKVFAWSDMYKDTNNNQRSFKYESKDKIKAEFI